MIKTNRLHDKYTRRLEETIELIEADLYFPEFPVYLNPSWVAGLRKKLKSMGYTIEDWHGVHDDIDMDWVIVRKP